MKSYVSLETKVCPVTGVTFQTDSLLLDMRLKNSMEKETVTGYAFCPEVQEKLDEGFVALVEADPEKSTGTTPDTVYRTGNILYLRKTVADQVFFKQEIETMAYIEPEVFEWLKNQAKPE